MTTQQVFEVLAQMRWWMWPVLGLILIFFTAVLIVVGDIVFN